MDKNKKTIIFDFDGTIADTFEHIVNLLDQYSGDFGVELADKAFLEDIRNYSMEELIKKMRVPKIMIPLIVKKAQKNIGENIDGIYPFYDVVKVLPYLRKRYNVGILTSNSRKNVLSFLKKENITDLFDFVFGSINLFGKDKLIEKTLLKYHISKEDVVYVGDEARDIQAATKVGIPIISVGWGFNSKKLLTSLNKDRFIDNADELLSKVNKVFS